jgi:hypothetical protein
MQGNQSRDSTMHAPGFLQTLRRCGRLKRAERELARLLNARLAALGTAWHARDAQYRTLWSARARVQAELKRTESALDRRFHGDPQRVTHGHALRGVRFSDRRLS